MRPGEGGMGALSLADGHNDEDYGPVYSAGRLD